MRGNYEQIRGKRRIINRAKVKLKLDAIGPRKASGHRRRELVKCLKSAYVDGRAEVRLRLEAGEINGRIAAFSLSYLSDQIIRLLYDYVTNVLYPRGNPTQAERIAVAATGGYGRGELAPYSDLDLLFLVPYRKTPWVENVVEAMLYALWDLGLKVGFATRSAKECVRLARKDLSTKTALLDMRSIWGDPKLYEDSWRRIRKGALSGSGADFVEAKLGERNARHLRMGDSRYVVEPNIKEGKGGLRDLQTLYWIGKYIYGVERVGELVDKGVLTQVEHQTYLKAESFLWTVRCYLHFAAGRAEERLGFDYQRDLAERLLYKDHPGLSGVERFMKHYFLLAKQVGDLTRVFCASLEARHQKRPLLDLSRFGRTRNVDGFVLDGERLTVGEENAFRETPLDLMRIFQVADKEGLDIHPDALRLIARDLHLIDRNFRRDPDANTLFLDILTSPRGPEASLRRMNEAGVFGRIVPDFGRIVAQSQFDMYHHYTVDEHTIRAIGLLSELERGGLESELQLVSRIARNVTARRVLYVSVLLHDIAKGRGGDHAVLGAEIADALCPRLGFNAAESELVAWLVRWHLLMSHFAFKRDLSDPTTIDNFVNRVKSPERLRLLFVLTVVDIRAVGPGIWNAWKRQLLDELFLAAEERLVAGHVAVGRDARVSWAKEALITRLTDWTKRARDDYLKRFGDAYWIAETPDTHERNARLVDEVGREGERIGVDVWQDKEGDVTRVSVLAPDVSHLFEKITGGLALIGANIRDAKIFTTVDGVALDNFAVQDAQGRQISNRRKLQDIAPTLKAAIDGEADLGAIHKQTTGIPRRSDIFRVEPFVVIDNRASKRFTVIEINARDRVGLLHDFAAVFASRGVSIHSAHVATYGERAVDVFYVEEEGGGRISHGRRLKTIKQKLLAAAEAQSEPGAGAEQSASG